MTAVRFGLMALMLWLFSGVAIAQAPGEQHVKIALLAESDHPAPGSEVTLAFASVPEKGWHAYWLNPGDAGLPARAEWTLPKGATTGEFRYPVPQRLTIAGLMNYVYEGPFAPLVTLKIPADAKGAFPVRVQLNYLVCTDAICVPGKADLATDLQIGDGSVSPDRRAQFDAWRAVLPRPLGAEGTYQVQGKALRLAVPFPAAARTEGEGYFFPATHDAFDYAAAQKVVRDGDRVVVDTAGLKSVGPIEGLLAFGKQGFWVRAVPGTVPPASAAAPAAQLPWSGAVLAFLGAVLGGLILNIMPCVFPILSLKALSLAKANAEGGSPRAEALAYTAGVVLVCLALGGALLALRAGGATLGWAFQLQDPRVILVLLLLVTGISFNLAGLFELSAPGFVNRAASKGTGGAFMTGALAAFVATPCTGPFMGAALGAALVLPWPAALAVFGGLGLGIALPFLLLGFIPPLRRLLPRPGAWMETLRRILSVPMFLTALALAWVVGKQAGVSGMTLGLAAALLATLGLWWTGLRQRRGKALAWLPAAALLLIAISSIAWVRAAPAESRTVSGGEKFSEARLAELTAQGKPVFAYFTADWCLTCKVNEKAVIETDAVERALADNKVTVLVGDWTDGDPVLGRFIERHNRAGVPLYLWYKPGEAEPRVLPQILTQGMLQDLAAGK
ncbi:protein-disulfide reductase DsbD domain-containing protein [Sphingomonas sp. NIBR02145]|uniref:protein-disulfide reductase DsbD family protein n=1 Tax=Sphingomonas sp. NIBR02145 TaxID=3014784 RepID=UPI0022B3D0D1|nr:protein-disulfide reductase DsbD domain-containing protein [Sphingomonas sp. NIBR02145]WHU02761.1 protein-disulfide reductase DsbD family protein [Sphingomonas sp. NIBR02145]